MPRQGAKKKAQKQARAIYASGYRREKNDDRYGNKAWDYLQKQKCGYCLSDRCIFPQRAFCLNISENGMRENFVEKEKCQKEVSELFGQIRVEILADNNLYNALVASIYSAICDNGAVYNIQDQRDLAEFIAKRIIGKG